MDPKSLIKLHYHKNNDGKYSSICMTYDHVCVCVLQMPTTVLSPSKSSMKTLI